MIPGAESGSGLDRTGRDSDEDRGGARGGGSCQSPQCSRILREVRLLELRKNARGQTRRKAADGLLNYVSDRLEMIRYPEFLAHGWQIGSGPMES